MTAVRTALVIGGGIAGPVAAMALRRAGIEPTVYEAYAGTADGVGGMLTVAPNGLDALRIIGADEVVRGIGQLDPKPRARAKSIAIWRERLARERDLPRAWIISDAAIFAVAQANPGSRAALGALDAMPANFNDAFAASLLQTLHEQSTAPVTDLNPSQDARPTAEQKALLARLAKVVDARAAELQVSAELLAPRGELKALAMGARDSHALVGWRREEIGNRLLESLV